MGLQVTCIKKSGGNHQDPHHAISRLGYMNDQTRQNGSCSREEMWDYVTKGGYAYVKDSWGNVAQVHARTHTNGLKFVQTVADGKYTDNLLYLPECP